MWQHMPKSSTLGAGSEGDSALCGLEPDVLGRHPRQDERRGKLHLVGPPARHACISKNDLPVNNFTLDYIFGLANPPVGGATGYWSWVCLQHAFKQTPYCRSSSQSHSS